MSIPKVNETILRQQFLYFLKTQYPNGTTEDGTTVSEIAKNPDEYQDIFNLFAGSQLNNYQLSGNNIFTNLTDSDFTAEDYASSIDYISLFKEGFKINGVSDNDIKALLADKKAVKLLGLDKNGKINDKLRKLLQGLDGDASSFTKDDFNKLKNIIAGSEDTITDEEFSGMIENATNEIESMLENILSPQSNSDFNFEIGDNTSTTPSAASNNANTNSNTNTGNDIEKNISGMTIDELKNELISSNASVEENTSELNSVINESSPELTEMKAAAEEAYNAYQESLKENDEKLAEELDQAKNNVEEKEKAIQETDEQINNKENELDNVNADISSAESNLSALESSLSSLQSEAASDDEEKKTAAQSKIESVKAQIENTKAKIEELKTQKDTIENEISDLENQKSAQETELSEANAVLSEVQTKATMLSDSNPELKSMQEQYEAANKAFNEFKTEQKAILTEQLQKSKEHLREVQTEINKRESSKITREYAPNGLTLSYNENGTEYDVVGINGFDSLEEFQRYVKNAGLTNLGKYGTKQCLNYSNIYGQLILGVANEELEAAFRAETEDETYGDVDRAGELGQKREYNTRNFRPIYSANLEEELNTVATELSEGRPVVFGNQNGSHYMIIVGMKQGATPPYSEGDFLMMDSYNGSISQLGTKRNIGKSNSLFVYEEGFRYVNGNQRIRYDELRNV